MSDKIEIIHCPTEEKPFLVIYKPKNLPSAPLCSNDTNNALAQAVNLFPELKNVKGKKDIEYGLLHRLDTPTDGLIVIAATQKVYDFLQQEQSEGRFEKIYSAKCKKLFTHNISEYLDGFPPVPEINTDNINIESYFRSYGPGKKEVRPVTNDSGKSALNKLGKPKLYKTNVKILKHDASDCYVECKIKEGFRHQVRCHLAWIGLPIYGDSIYNPFYDTQDKKNAVKDLCFTASKICFEYPKGDLNSYEITFTWT